jgi:hypothetical protein
VPPSFRDTSGTDFGSTEFRCPENPCLGALLRSAAFLTILIAFVLLALCGTADAGTWRGVLEKTTFGDTTPLFASRSSSYSSWRLIGRASDGGSTFLFHTQGNVHFDTEFCSPYEENWNVSGSGPAPGHPSIAVASAQKKNKRRFTFAVYGANAPYRETITGGVDPNSDWLNPTCLPPRLGEIDPVYPTYDAFPNSGSIGRPELSGRQKKGKFSSSYRGSTVTENAGNGPCVAGEPCTREVLTWRLTFRRDGDCDGIENARDKKTTPALCNTTVLP